MNEIDFLEKTNKRGPSKKFIIRGTIAILIVGGILIYQTNWLQALFNKKNNNNSKIIDSTVGELVEKDTNGNGIADWEERLWGLDPTVLYTNGVSNKQIIAEKRKAAGVVNLDPDAPISDMDKFAQEIYALSVSLNQNGNSGGDIALNIGETLGSNVPIITTVLGYKLSDLKTTKTTYLSLKNYKTNLESVILKNNFNISSSEIIISALQSEDYSRLSELDLAGKQYTDLAKSLKNITVPVGVAQAHLNLMNSFYGMAESFVYLQKVQDDSMKAFSGLALYKKYALLNSEAVSLINDYFTKYGII